MSGVRRSRRSDPRQSGPGAFATAYPNLTRWVATHGLLEIGFDGMRPSFIRLLDEGGMLWEAAGPVDDVDDALRAAEAAADRCIREEGLAG